MGDAALSWGRPDGTPFAVLSGSFELPEYRKLTQSIKAQPLSARVQGGWDLAAIEAFSDDFTESAGRLELDMSAGGTVAEPELTGTVRLSGQTDIPRLGLNLREIELTASADAQGELTISGRALSGDGYVVIDGHSPPLPSRESPTRLAVRGDRFLAAETEEIHLEVSPDIEVLFTGTNIEVSGDITIPSATFEVLEIPASAVPVSPDVVFVGQEEDGGAKHVPVSANVRFVLGDEVFFKGFGFSSRLMGAITVSETPGAPARGSGELVFREGVYRGYGQNLTIDPGRLVFAGPIDNPGLDVRAYRTATDGKKAGLLILGTLKEPDVQVWSDPAMSQSEALAYMLFGRPMEQGSQADQASAASAAAALGGSMLAMSMASQIGLDDARIETGTKREDAAFVAGKYLSPQLYVAYGVGLFEPVNTLRIRYLLTSKITLQAVTGSKESTDILYRIER
jgi:translocation and assembly module TamB